MNPLLLFLILALPTFASVPLQLSDEKLAARTDHVLVARVIGVDMIDQKGRQIKNENARTGPGSKNLIRLKVRVLKVLATNSKKIPRNLHVPLDPFMHYELGQVKKAHDGDESEFLLLLSGPDFKPPLAGVFRRDLKKKAFFVNRVTQKHAK